MKKALKNIFILLAIFLAVNLISVYGIECSTNAQLKTQQQIDEFDNQCVKPLRPQINSLSQQILYLTNQVYLTSVQIQQTEQKIISTEKEIDVLGTRIEGLDQSLDYISKLLLNKIVQGYKQREVSLFSMLFDSENADDLLAKIKYVKTTRDNNQRLLIQVQETKSNFEEQKTLREEKKQELDNLIVQLGNQKADLDNQKIAQQRLLTETQNNEQIYQGLLSKARAELVAIQGIIAGAGTETQLREVKKGDVIASMISGASCNSSGTHLHFIIQEGSSVQNPFNYLKDVDHIDYTGGDPWNPSGSWDWPISPRIEFNQGYGETWAVRNTWVGNIYRFHNGIDVFGSSYNVYSVADGTLYRGSYNVGCTLSYTKLVHKDSNINTLYLHTYTQ
ncbi:hypothetical protein A2970_00440 [Candidatus Roizmanbacteria bacterium RIFCSPLOWO2_01_FULL_44_13]|uniref:Peptidase M23 domain-containing protein n=1 Tax=Candidatus Roizmanbacteria bacterium RIFCSPLOWO2_01_FULL_44_13 TaxID=1802069 RepID=A0A1F7JBV9_9BACT|nr:MAG: hypothetical protein A2970_00440 [Candidatus Roizmanbacteria bacterium RIFCSPLOWO2_01_FULL_44_13]